MQSFLGEFAFPNLMKGCLPMVPISPTKCIVRTDGQNQSVILKYSLTLYRVRNQTNLVLAKHYWSKVCTCHLVIQLIKFECYTIAVLFFCISMLCYSQSLSLTKASGSHPPQYMSTGNYHFYFAEVNTYSVWHFLKRGLKKIIMYLYLLFLIPSSKPLSINNSLDQLCLGRTDLERRETLQTALHTRRKVDISADPLWVVQDAD